MEMYELEKYASKCFKDYDTFCREMNAFKSDCEFFDMYMKCNAKSIWRLVPIPITRSLDYSLKNFKFSSIEKAFCIFYICRQIVLDLQDWNTQVYTSEEITTLVRYMARNEYVEFKVFCDDWIGCSMAHADIVAKLECILGE